MHRGKRPPHAHLVFSRLNVFLIAPASCPDNSTIESSVLGMHSALPSALTVNFKDSRCIYGGEQWLCPGTATVPSFYQNIPKLVSKPFRLNLMLLVHKDELPWHTHPAGSLSRPWHTAGFNNPYSYCTIVVVIVIQNTHMSIYTMLLISACQQAGSLGAVNPCTRHPNTVQSPLLLFSQSIEERQ